MPRLPQHRTSHLNYCARTQRISGRIPPLSGRRICYSTRCPAYPCAFPAGEGPRMEIDQRVYGCRCDRGGLPGDRCRRGCEEALSSHNGWLGLYGNMPLAARTLGNRFGIRCLTTADHYEELSEENSASIAHDALPQRIKVKRPDKTARHIMNILDKEAVEKANAGKVIPDVRAGYIIELKVEAPENKGRVSTIKGLVIGRKNAGISTSIRVRRMESNVGVETVFPLYSPNIKSIKVLERRSVRRAKLFYIRDKPFNVALRELAQRTAKKKEMVQKSSKKHQSKK